MIRPENETEDLILSNTKNCEKLIEQTHRKAEETLEFKMIQSKKKHFILMHISRLKYLGWLD